MQVSRGWKALLRVENRDILLIFVDSAHEKHGIDWKYNAGDVVKGGHNVACVDHLFFVVHTWVRGIGPDEYLMQQLVNEPVIENES